MADSVPFLYKQYKSAMRIGKPQPLNTFEQNAPSFEPSTIKAIKIQRVTLPEKQQFINKPPVFRRRGYVDCSETENACGFIFLLT
jgi:hypothetical protein